MPPRRRTPNWLAGLTIAIVAAVAIFGRQRVVEEWYLHQLKSDDHAIVDNAALRLGEMKSVRAIEPLIALVRTAAQQRQKVSPIQSLSDLPPAHRATAIPALKALHDIGERAKLAVEEAGDVDIGLLRDLFDVDKLVYIPEDQLWYRVASGFTNCGELSAEAEQIIRENHPDIKLESFQNFRAIPKSLNTRGSNSSPERHDDAVPTATPTPVFRSPEECPCGNGVKYRDCRHGDTSSSVFNTFDH